ncbi:MHFG family PEP-CTERM protein [Pseudoduganella buxea]|uniref:Ice-binding protein C-terminal domain-containing protein n=2 Tax=Pseudoduganella buxea TaxID=1949069 RepID=A0ABQ1KBF9_9BURK|nr:MHFG family PEP-CTERM protein [Pseudoduganella buxea]GGB94728.1 hypothetical protein GCM10011572_15850 [Pseudoduganella buxea]
MAIMLAAAAAALLVQPVCSWDRPGVNRYRGTPEAALAHYRDIPASTRTLLAQRIAAGIPDDTVQIGRDRIEGHFQYDQRIGDMHFGKGQLCRTVTRTKWKSAHREPAAVYCAENECILVPKVCGNVSRIRRVVTSGAGGGGGHGGGSPAPVELPPFPPPAGPSYSAAPAPGDDMPPWAGPGVPVPKVPLPDYPGPGAGWFYPVGELPLAPVPEPSTWAMLLAGVGLLAARWRRK